MIWLLLGFITILLVVQTVRIELYRVRLPDKTINTIRGVLFPRPEDPRWRTNGAEITMWSERETYFLEGSAISIRRFHTTTDFLAEYDLFIEKEKISGFDVKRYFLKIKHEYLQRKALEAIEAG